MKIEEKNISVYLINNWISICEWIESSYHFQWTLKIKIEKDLNLIIGDKSKNDGVFLEEWRPGYYKSISKHRTSDNYRFDEYLNGKKNLLDYDIKALKTLLFNWNSVKSAVQKGNEEYSEIVNFKI